MGHEIMENDNMFSVGQTPWHGLGIILDSPPTIEEGIATAKLDWEVAPIPLYAKVKIGEHFKGIDVQHRAILRQDTGEILGVVGPNWTPLQNREAFGIFAPLVEDKSILLETAGSLKNGRRVWILARINADGADIAPGDQVKPYVLLSNAHDGTMAVRLGFTPIRVVCNNTLSIAESADSSRLVRVIHSLQLHSNLAALRNMLDLSKTIFTTTIEQYRWLAGRDIIQADLEKYVKIVLSPDFEKELADAQAKNEGVEIILSPTQNKVIQLFQNGIGSNLSKARSWWGAYNAVNEWLMYHRGQSADNRLNSAWFADGYNVNQRALSTALKMAA